MLNNFEKTIFYKINFECPEQYREKDKGGRYLCDDWGLEQGGATLGDLLQAERKRHPGDRKNGEFIQREKGLKAT